MCFIREDKGGRVEIVDGVTIANRKPADSSEAWGVNGGGAPCFKRILRPLAASFRRCYGIMEQHLINGGIVTVLYAVLKFVDLRFVSKTEASVRHVARELVMVYASSVAGFYVADNVNAAAIKKSTAAFVGKPTF